MEKLPKCYGAYSCADATKCEYAAYCADAGDPKNISWRPNLSFDEYPVMLERMVSEQGADNEGSDLSKLFGELIVALDCDNAGLMWDFLSCMSALSKEHPITYAVVRMKVLYPLDSYRDLGTKLGMSHQSVANHLDRSAELIPSLKAAVKPSDRCQPPAKEVVRIRCAGNKVRLELADGTILLEAGQTLRNGHTLTAVVTALNQQHWVKRDAFLEAVQ